MAKKVNVQSSSVDQTVQYVPVVEGNEQKTLVNCPKCGAALYTQSCDVVYMCPVCNNLMRVRIGERLVKDISPVMAVAVEEAEK